MAMMDFSIGEIGGFFTDIRRAITGEEIKDPEKLLIELNKMESEIIKSRSEVVISEAKGESWLQRNWRPITMLVFVFIIANNFILVPYFDALTTIKIPTLVIPENMWDMISLGLTGYIVGRSIEKSIKEYKK